MQGLKHSEELTGALTAFAAEPGSVLDGALLVSRIVNPDTDVDWCRARLAELAALLPAAAGANDVSVMLAAQGFRGSESYYKSENSALQSVLETGEGIPISLAMVVAGVCEAAGLEVTGINFPGHFLVAVDGALIDPFVMEVLDEAEVRERLQGRNMPASQALLPATPVGTVLRMLNNLSGIAMANDDAPRALELTDFKLLLADDALPVYLERADLWTEIGAIAMARRDLTAAIGLLPEGAGRAELEQRLEFLAGTPSRLH